MAMKAQVVCAMPTCGKSTLVRQHPNVFIDTDDLLPANWPIKSMSNKIRMMIQNGALAHAIALGKGVVLTNLVDSIRSLRDVIDIDTLRFVRPEPSDLVTRWNTRTPDSQLRLDVASGWCRDFDSHAALLGKEVEILKQGSYLEYDNIQGGSKPQLSLYEKEVMIDDYDLDNRLVGKKKRLIRTAREDNVFMIYNESKYQMHALSAIPVIDPKGMEGVNKAADWIIHFTEEDSGVVANLADRKIGLTKLVHLMGNITDDEIKSIVDRVDLKNLKK